jgi:predicted DNA-binding WGR domain protein
MTYTAQFTELQYRDPAANSNKYYRAYLLADEEAGEWRVLFNWGRNGAHGQFSNLVCPTYSSAAAAVSGKLNDKVKKGYRESGERTMSAVPDDLLELAGVSVNARSKAADKISADPFARVEVDTDRLIRLVTGPAQVQAEAITLKHGLDAQMAELRRRLLQAEGSLELASDVMSMKLGA